MLEILKQVILDNQAVIFQQAITPRNLAIRAVEGKATICIGVRRCGKSTYMLQIMRSLLEQGVAGANILHLDFFDNRLHELQIHGLELVLEAYYSLYPEKKNTEKIYCFFDEIQIIENWESFINRLLRTEKCDVYITGSSAKMLAKEIASQMRGRSLSWEIFPYSFQEYLNIHKVETGPITTKQRLLINKYFDLYFIEGGFPEIANLLEPNNRVLRTKIHQEYFSNILFRDLIERYDVKHPKAVLDLAQFLINNVASKYSINSLYKYLAKSLKHNIAHATISQYINWLEDAYFLFSVYKYDASIRTSELNEKKIYCIDHAMVTSNASGVMLNNGHLLENIVYVSLRRTTDRIFYYRTKTSKEVDFLTLSGNKKLVQVCHDMSNPTTAKREIDALSEAMQELNLSTGIIVTRSQKNTISVTNGTIQLIPAWEFLLETVDNSATV
jgi:uncharacterized protein